MYFVLIVVQWLIKRCFSTISNARKSMSILINRISNKSIPDGGKSVYQVTVKTDHARHPLLPPSPSPPLPRYFIHWITVGPETYEVRFPWQRKPSSVASRQEGGEGVGGRADNLYRTGVAELIFVGLFHFVPIKVLRSWNSLGKLSLHAGIGPFLHCPPNVTTLLAVSSHYFRQPRGDIHLPPPRSSISGMKAAIVDGIIGRNIPGIGGARDMSLEMKRSKMDRS